jgi:DNA polymerase-3 subunit delta
LAAGRIDPLYLLTGEESWLVDETLAAFRRHVVPDGDVLNTHLYSGADLDTAAFLDSAETLPAFSSHRLMIVRDAERLAPTDALTAYVRHPSPTTCLVLVMAKPDRRKNFVQALMQHATVVACTPLPARALREWIVGQAAARGLALTEEAVAYLQERSGDSLRALAQELEKAALNQAADGGPTDIAALDPTSTGGVVSIFDWVEWVATGHVARALEALAGPLRDEPPLVLLSVLTGQWRKMLRCVALAEDGVPTGRWATELGVPPFAVGRLREASRGRHPAELLAGLTWCLETDSALKGGAIAGSRALERLVIALGGGSGSPPAGRTLTGAWWSGLLARGGRRGAVGSAGQT